MFGKTALMEAEMGAAYDDRTAGIVNPFFPTGSGGTGPVLPLSMSGEGVRAAIYWCRYDPPSFQLSKRASTASWSILFSFLMIISGAFSSINRFSRFVPVMTLR